MALHSQPEL